MNRVDIAMMGLLDKGKMVVVVVSFDVVVNVVDVVVYVDVVVVNVVVIYIHRVDITMGLLDKAKMVVFNVSLEPVFFLFCVNLGLVMIPNADLYLSKVGSFLLK